MIDTTPPVVNNEFLAAISEIRNLEYGKNLLGLAHFDFEFIENPIIWDRFFSAFENVLKNEKNPKQIINFIHNLGKIYDSGGLLDGKFLIMNKMLCVNLKRAISDREFFNNTIDNVFLNMTYNFLNNSAFGNWRDFDSTEQYEKYIKSKIVSDDFKNSLYGDYLLAVEKIPVKDDLLKKFMYGHLGFYFHVEMFIFYFKINLMDVGCTGFDYRPYDLKTINNSQIQLNISYMNHFNKLKIHEYYLVPRGVNNAK